MVLLDRSSCCSWRSWRVSLSSSSGACRSGATSSERATRSAARSTRIIARSAQIEGHLAEATAAAASLKEASDRLGDVPRTAGRPARGGARGARAGAARVLVRSRPVRVGAVDLGTNSTRLLVADVEEGHITEIVRRLAITRLGEGVDDSATSSPDAIARVHGVLEDYAREAAALGAERVLAVATSAVRDAANGRRVPRPAWKSSTVSAPGSSTAARRPRRRSAASRQIARSSRTLLVDIGGGSTELVVGGPDGVSVLDEPPGGMRSPDRALPAVDPPPARSSTPPPRTFARCSPTLDVDGAIGVAGTVTTVGGDRPRPRRVRRGADPRPPDHARLPRRRVLADLASLRLAERERVPASSPRARR